MLNFGWRDWISENGYRSDVYTDKNSFKFKLKDDALILTITNHEQLISLPVNREVEKRMPGLSGWNYYIDFERLAKNYDAIEVLISEDHELYWKLYGWDCDSILIFNKDVIEVI